VLTGRADRAWRPDWGDVAVSIRSQGRFTAGRVRLLPHVTVFRVSLEWGRGIEPRSRRLQLRARPTWLTPHAELLAPAEQNRTLLRGFGVRVVPQNTPAVMAGSLGIEPSSFRLNRAAHSP